jgi:hypothetical protein
MMIMTGHSLTTTIEYESVWFRIAGEQLSTSTDEVIREADIVAIVHWKNRKCH